jgi:glycosyltransferase involved in cell wall biosynthesis
MLTGKDIICISTIDWDFIWQGPQEVMATLAEMGNRVLFIENTGVRAATVRDLSRIRQRVRNWLRGNQGFRQVKPNVFVYAPLLLPLPYSRLARRLNRAILIAALRRWMRTVRFRQPIFWTFLPTPLAQDLSRTLRPELTIFYCVDDLASSSPGARRIAASEAAFFRESDLVFVTSNKLFERATHFRDQVHLFPSGVNFRKFEEARHRGAAVPADLRALGRPVVGYVGGVHQWFDQGLLVEVATRLPRAQFALVGPLQSDTSRLARCRNVHLLGTRPHSELPFYVQGFDVGIVPYRLTDYTANVYPTKVTEYLAMGIPVVSTDLPEIRYFNSAYGEVVAVAHDAAQFVGALERAIAGGAPGDAARRIEVAQQNSWDARITQMSALIDEALAARQGAGRC